MFELKNFACAQVNPSKCPTPYSYVTDDTMATVLGTGYFNKLFDVLKVNDLILVTSAANTGTPVISYVRVSAIANKVVTVVDGINITL
jgi:hypothetical protein